MYNLTVDEVHTFFIGDGEWLVHNCAKQMELFPDPNRPDGLKHNELEVGSYGGLTKLGSPGDELTPHHMPPDAYMSSGKGPKNYTTDAGTAIMMDEGRHERTWSYGKQFNYSEMKPRDLLAKDIWDVRRIYREDGLYSPYVSGKLGDAIERNKMAWPGLFKKR
jgi:filamentous hemagglutinin